MAFKLFNISHSDRVARSMVDLFLSDELLREWTESRIYRANMLGLIEGLAAPYIMVMSALEEDAFGIGSRSQVTQSVGILVLWEDELKILREHDEATIISVVQHIKGILADKSNYFLKEPGSTERLTERLESFSAVDYQTQDLDGNRFTQYLILRAVYRLDLKVETRERLQRATSP